MENSYRERVPDPIKIELQALNLLAEADSALTTPAAESYNGTPFSQASRLLQIQNSTATLSFTVTNIQTGEEKDYRYLLSNDIYFVTAHPCVPSPHVKIFKSPSSPTIQQVDISGHGNAGKTASLVGKYPLRPLPPCLFTDRGVQPTRCTNTLPIRSSTSPTC